ncbi:MAG: hypothetical protein ABEI27_12200 [Halobellus sp.]|uniref:hypothetical protein n=1 Tax=Halobellus sp. TaxID=1979212 RepID=UPI0035D49D2A
MFHHAQAGFQFRPADAEDGFEEAFYRRFDRWLRPADCFHVSVTTLESEGSDSEGVATGALYHFGRLASGHTGPAKSRQIAVPRVSARLHNLPLVTIFGVPP